MHTPYSPNSEFPGSPAKWRTCKQTGIACAGCGKISSCTVSPDRTAFKCWRDDGRIHQTRPQHFNQPHPQPDPRPTIPEKTFISAEEAVAYAGYRMNNAVSAGVWKYGDAAQVARFDVEGGKEFRPVHRTASGAWAIGDPPGLWPLYRASGLPAEGIIHVCEGEKAADRAWAIGLPAITSAHGASSPHLSDWSGITGRDVIILPDADKAGEGYARKVAAILLHNGCRVKIVRLPGLPAGGDIVEFDASYGGTTEATRCAIEEIATNSPWIQPSEILGGPVLICLADVQAKSVQWLWPGKMALGRISLIVGRPGAGKSLLTTDLAARVTTGSPWPDGSPSPQGSVIVVSAEDDAGDTFKPRCLAHHADCNKIHLLSMVRRLDEEGKPYDVQFTLADIPALEQSLRQVTARGENCRLIVIDPIGSFLGGHVDSHRDSEVRSVLTPVAQLAEKYNAAVLLIAHRRKSSSLVADNLALGSVAFTGIARAVHHLSIDPQNKNRRLLLPGKNNLAPEGNGLAFMIAGSPAAIAWEKDPVEMNADEALAVENEKEDKPGPKPAAKDEAIGWLRDLLADGPVESAQVRAEAKSAGLAWATIRRAAEELGVTYSRCENTGARQWQRAQVPPEVKQLEHLST